MAAVLAASSQLTMPLDAGGFVAGLRCGVMDTIRPQIPDSVLAVHSRHKGTAQSLLTTITESIPASDGLTQEEIAAKPWKRHWPGDGRPVRRH